MKKVTIKDIALKAGVSIGTVDRILHNRGKVNKDVSKRVTDIMNELGYRKNIIASTLAFNKKLTFAAILPNPEIDPYWAQPDTGINQAQKTVRDFGIQIKKYWFDLFDESTFINTYKNAIGESPNAILLAPIFAKESKKLIKVAKEKSIPIILINTYLDDDYPLSYIGQDSYQSGFLGGRLIQFGLEKNAQVMVLNLGERSINAQHLLKKEKGFNDFFRKNAKSIEVIKADFFDFDDSTKLKFFLKKKLKQFPNLKGIYVTTSRAYKLIEAFPEHETNIKIVGFDLLKQNINYLIQNKITFLINQHPVEQGYRGIISLFNHFVKKEAIEKTQFLPLDIVVVENYKFYLENTTISEIIA